MKFGNTDVYLLSDGTFTLETGACFGVVPKKIWSRQVKESENNRITMALNVPLIVAEDWTALIDSGVGSSPDERMARIYEISKHDDIMDQVEQKTGKRDVDYIVHSHLHFDHMGHSFEQVSGGISFPGAKRIAQSEEYRNFRNTNEVTRGSYVPYPENESRFNVTRLDGSTAVRDGLRVVKTGGHTSGHQAIILENGGKGMIYFGDIMPSSFNVRLPYITAIDTFPLDTLEMKRDLISLAIRRNYLCVFNHDMKIKAGYLTGSVEKAEVEPVEF